MSIVASDAYAGPVLFLWLLFSPSQGTLASYFCSSLLCGCVLLSFVPGLLILGSLLLLLVLLAFSLPSLPRFFLSWPSLPCCALVLRCFPFSLCPLVLLVLGRLVCLSGLFLPPFAETPSVLDPPFTSLFLATSSPVDSPYQTRPRAHYFHPWDCPS